MMLLDAALFHNRWLALPHRFVLSLSKLDITTNVHKNILINFSWVNCSLQFEEKIDLLQVVVFFSFSDRQSIEFITDSECVSKFVTPCNPSALCLGAGSMLFFVDELTSHIFQLDCSKMPPARVVAFTQTQKTKIYDLSYFTHQNKDLIVTTNGESGVSAYCIPGNFSGTVWVKCLVQKK